MQRLRKERRTLLIEFLLEGGTLPAIQLLGPVRLVDADKNVPVQGRQARLFLASVAIAHPTPVPDHRLVDVLWGDEVPKSFGSALRVHASSLRKQLRSIGLGLDRLRERGYSLAGDVTTDVALMQERWSQVSAVQQPHARLEALGLILNMWRGESVADLRRSTYGDRLAASLDSQRHDVQLAFFSAAIEAGRSHTVIHDLLVLEREDPLDTNVVCLLAQALYDQRRHDRGLRVLAGHRRQLAEIGLDPDPQVGELELRLLEHEARPPTQESHSAKVWPAPRSVQAAVPRHLFGRREVLRDLDGELEQARIYGSLRVACIHGSAGVGKSATLATFGHRAALRGSHVLHGWGVEPRSTPFGAMAPVVKRLLDITDRAWPPMLAHLMAADPLAASSDPLGSEPTAGLLGRRILTEEVAQLLDATDGDQPTILLLDDYQLVDEVSDTTIRALLREPPNKPVLIVVGSRSAASLGGRSIELEPLEPSELAEWMEVSGVVGSAGDVEEVHATTGGLPLIVKLLEETGWSAVPEGGRRAFLSDRLELLQRRARFTLEWLALIGPEADLELLSAVLPQLHTLGLLEDLDEASRIGLLDLRQGGEVARFSHALLRETVRRSISARRQAEMAKLIFNVAPKADPLRRLEWAETAGELIAPEIHVESSLLGARHLIMSYSFKHARQVLEQALPLANPGSLHEARCLLNLGRCYVGESLANEATSMFEQASTLATQLGDPTLLAECVAASGGLGHGYTHDGATKKVLRRAAFGDEAIEPSTHTSILVRLAIESLNEGEIGGLREVLDVASYNRLQESADESAAVFGYLDYWHATLTGDILSRQRALAFLSDLETEDLSALCYRLHALSVDALEQGEVARCSEHAAELIEVGRAAGRPTSVWLARASQFVAPFLAGDFDTAKRRSTEALNYANEFNLAGGLSAFGAQQFAISWFEGNLQQFIEPLETAEFPGNPFAWQAGLALAYAVTGRHDDARHVLSSLRPNLGAAATHYQAVVGIGVAVQAARLAGDEGFATSALAPLEKLGGRRLILGAATADFGPASLYRALCHLTLGDQRRAEQEIRRTPADSVPWGSLLEN